MLKVPSKKPSFVKPKSKDQTNASSRSAAQASSTGQAALYSHTFNANLEKSVDQALAAPISTPSGEKRIRVPADEKDTEEPAQKLVKIGVQDVEQRPALSMLQLPKFKKIPADVAAASTWSLNHLAPRKVTNEDSSEVSLASRVGKSGGRLYLSSMFNGLADRETRQK